MRVVDAEIVHLIGDTWIPRDHEQVSILGPAGWAQVEHAVTSLASAARPSHPVPMADERLQQLRRAWDEGDLETQARLLSERLRAGELHERRVRLASYLGSEVAAGVLGERVPAAQADLERWAYGFQSFERTAAVRAGIVLANLSCEVLEGSRWFGAAFTAAAWLERWVVSPTDHLAARARATDWVAELPYPGEDDPPESWSHRRAAGCIAQAGSIPSKQRYGHALAAAVKAVPVPHAAVALDAVRAELIPWALGVHDPVAARVSAAWVHGDGGPAIVLQQAAVELWEGANDFDNSLMQGGTVETDYDVVCSLETEVGVIHRHERDMLVLAENSYSTRFMSWGEGDVTLLQLFGTDLEPEELATKLLEREPDSTRDFMLQDSKLRLMVAADGGPDPFYLFAEIEVSPGPRSCEERFTQEGLLIRLRRV